VDVENLHPSHHAILSRILYINYAIKELVSKLSCLQHHVMVIVRFQEAQV
jgi:hypothetical protein